MNNFFNILNAIKDTVSPLPDPKDPVAIKFWYRHSKFLTETQIEAIIGMVVEEARISRGFGLFLRPEDLNQEIGFWLVLINYLAGPKVISEKFTFELFLEYSTKQLDREFAEIGKHYFDQISGSTIKSINSNNAFRLHLEAVRARIINAIFNNGFPETNLS